MSAGPACIHGPATGRRCSQQGGGEPGGQLEKLHISDSWLSCSCLERAPACRGACERGTEDQAGGARGALPGARLSERRRRAVRQRIADAWRWQPPAESAGGSVVAAARAEGAMAGRQVGRCIAGRAAATLQMAMAGLSPQGARGGLLPPGRRHHRQQQRTGWSTPAGAARGGARQVGGRDAGGKTWGLIIAPVPLPGALLDPDQGMPAMRAARPACQCGRRRAFMQIDC
jgi:hypothetical protein